ncbi:MAG TPA: nitroreductase family deazaflavin-dependent oxidoreductase [Dehalococcoidia bacterium]|jgi:deazaflavin-dependent oxidoreductase (nitroreductase family)
MQDYNNNIIKEFHENEGKVGGPFAGAPMILVTHTGAKSGTQRTNPLVYAKDGDRYLIFGSKGGSTKHPDWYRNLVANPNATVEIGTEKFDVVAEVLTGAERDRLYNKQAKIMPQFAEYQARAGRTIPVVALKRKS